MSEHTDGRPTRVLSAELSAALAAYRKCAAEASACWEDFKAAPKGDTQEERRKRNVARAAWWRAEEAADAAGRAITAVCRREEAREGERSGA